MPKKQSVFRCDMEPSHGVNNLPRVDGQKSKPQAIDSEREAL